MVPNRATHHTYLDQENEVIKNGKKKLQHSKSKRAKKSKLELLLMDQKQMSILNKIEKEVNDDDENHNKDNQYLFPLAIAADIRAFSKAMEIYISMVKLNGV